MPGRYVKTGDQGIALEFFIFKTMSGDEVKHKSAVAVPKAPTRGNSSGD